MKKKMVFVFLVVLIGFFGSCISVQTSQMTPGERAEAEVVGTVTASWISFSFSGRGSLENKAMSELKAEAQRKGFTGNIEIKNVRIGGSFHILTIFYGLFQKVTASGDVVMYSTDSGRNRAFQQTVEGALERAAEQTLKNVPQRSKIAIVYITVQDASTTDFIAGELEYIWVNSGYTIIDRSQLDRIKREQNFQMSGEVDDDTAVSIGKIAGANVIVIGTVDGEGNLRRLRLRALDTQTAQVVGVASERL
ncbi:hypothetical protein FACS1894151_11370 [Spirochaetia bacterium]|nr:hypothetical protein FACS1894151_11370 [Spirochaetia bacterium]